MVPGINLPTPLFIPLSHSVPPGYLARTAISYALLNTSYTFKSQFSKKGLMKLKEIKSPFIVFKGEKTWISDEDFSMRVVQGPSPQNIRKAALNDNILTKTNKDLLYQLTGMEDESVYSRLYILDYSIFEGLKTKKGFIAVAPQTLFFQSPDKELLKPIAIVLNPEDPTIYTPLDNEAAWILAKNLVLQQEVLYMPLINHVVESHLWMDPVIIATDFCLPKGHPLNSLLSDHLKGSFAINKMAYYLLLKPKGFFDQISQFTYPEVQELVKRGLKNFNIHKRIVPDDITERDVEGIVYYPYRDDVKLIWDALKKYVTNYLDYFYPEQKNLDEDKYLKKWRSRIKNELGIEDSVSTPDLITAILFNIYDHNIQQNSIVDYYLNPFHAIALVGTIPASKSEITEELLFEFLSDIKSKVGRGILIRAITDQTEVYAPVKFDNANLNKISDDFQKAIKEIEETIIQKNKSRLKPYTAACPSNIDNSIKI